MLGALSRRVAKPYTFVKEKGLGNIDLTWSWANRRYNGT